MLNWYCSNMQHFSAGSLQAEKLRSKAQRPEVSRSTQQLCRYLYYLGRIRAIQLEYTDSKDCLQQALRKVQAALLTVFWLPSSTSQPFFCSLHSNAWPQSALLLIILLLQRHS